MDTVYSSTLLVSLVLGGVAVLLGLYARFRSAPSSPAGRLARGAVLFATLSLVVSVVVHWIWGHGPSSLEPMTAGPFIQNHAAFLVSGLLVTVGWVLGLRLNGDDHQG